MKLLSRSLTLSLALLLGRHFALAQNPVITSFSLNGVLVCSNLNPGSVATVEWAPSVTGPWTNNWNSLAAVAVGSNKTIQVSVPMFYRVTGVAATNSVPPGMVSIPAGSFMMGNLVNDYDILDASNISVYVSAFYMETNLVSSNLWRSVFAYATNHGYNFNNHNLIGKGANYPVHQVNWYDSVKWCNARSQQAGLTPVYYTNAALTQVFTNGDSGATVYANWSANGYRLPTEAEWEKAARGGLSGQRFPWGPTNTISQSVANYFGVTTIAYDLGPNGYNAAYATGSQPYTSPVGSFAPNGYGLFDMSGNLNAWCWDWYAAPPYPAGSPYLGGSDPRGPASGSVRVYRGGSWLDNAAIARCGKRVSASPSNATARYGLRCVRSF